MMVKLRNNKVNKTNFQRWKGAKHSSVNSISPTTSSRLQAIQTVFYETTREFCLNTTLHGLRYVGERNLNKFERVFFGIAFVAAFIGAIQFIHNVYLKWSSTPVIVGISAVPVYVDHIPFPAVTICNMNQALRSKVSKIDRQSVEFAILQTLCDRDVSSDSEAYNSNSTGEWGIFEKFFREYTQPCLRLLIKCRYSSVDLNCSEIFRPVLTDEGHCCTFNAVDVGFMYKHTRTNDFFQEPQAKSNVVPVAWTPEKGYPDKLPKSFFPRVAQGTGSGMGLSLILDADVSEYYCSSSNGAGFKVLLHNPTETPDVGESGFLIAPGYETRVVITPHKYDTAPVLKGISKDARQCYFEDEVNLIVYSTYSRRNCEMECETMLLARECNCTSHYMPPLIPNMTICSPKDFDCLDTLHMKTVTSFNNMSECSSICMSGCFELTYTQSTFSAPMHNDGYNVKNRYVQKIPVQYLKDNIAVVHFYYTDKAFRSNTKEQFIGFTEFLSNTGGLMGLFLGFSFISIVEIFYYSCVRPFFTGKRKLAEADLKNEREIFEPSVIKSEFRAHEKILNKSMKNSGNVVFKRKY